MVEFQQSEESRGISRRNLQQTEFDVSLRRYRSHFSWSGIWSFMSHIQHAKCIQFFGLLNVGLVGAHGPVPVLAYGLNFIEVMNFA